MGTSNSFACIQILGSQYNGIDNVSRTIKNHFDFDDFTSIKFGYPTAVDSLKTAKSAKSEGELVVSGTKGYIYVPEPW